MKTKYKMEGCISVTSFIFCIVESIFGGLINMCLYNNFSGKKPDFFLEMINEINHDPHLDEHAKHKKKTQLINLFFQETTTTTATLNGGTTK